MSVSLPNHPKIFLPSKQPQVLNHACCCSIILFPLLLNLWFFHHDSENSVRFIHIFFPVFLLFFWIRAGDFLSKSGKFFLCNKHKTPRLTHSVGWCPNGIF